MASSSYPTFTDGIIATTHLIQVRNECFEEMINFRSENPPHQHANNSTKIQYIIYENVIWDYSTDIMKYGTDENKESMIQFAENCEMSWNENTMTFESMDDDDMNNIDEGCPME